MTTKPDTSYIQFIQELKQEIKTSQIKAHLAVNRELILLYFKIGKAILEKQKQEGWGTQVTKRVSEDLQKEFPDMKGLSYTNVRYMQRFAEAYSDFSICQQPVGKLEILPQAAVELRNKSICHQAGGKLDFNISVHQIDKVPFFNIPWRHNTELLDQVSSNEQRFGTHNKPSKTAGRAMF